MPDLPEFTATAAPDGLSFTMARGAWHHRAPLADLPGWIRFYQDMHDRGAAAPKKGQTATPGGPYAHFYAQPLAALKALQDQIKARP